MKRGDHLKHRSYLASQLVTKELFGPVIQRERSRCVILAVYDSIGELFKSSIPQELWWAQSNLDIRAIIAEPANMSSTKRACLRTSIQGIETASLFGFAEYCCRQGELGLRVYNSLGRACQ